MNTNTMPLEAETRVLIDRSLENLGWKLSGKDQNVYYEQPRSEAEKKKLGGKRPDYVLYSKDSDKPLIVIEAKKKGVRLDAALEQGIQYAKAIEAPLVFATDGVFCKAFHTVANRPPILNGEEIDEFIRESLALRYLTSYEVNTVSPKVQYDRKELIRIFDEANNMLRGEGLRAGIERFGEFANILFLKLISESEQIKRESGIQTKFDIACSWDSIKQIPSSTRIEYINKTVYDNVAFAMRVIGAKGREIRQRVPYVLELVGLETKSRRHPYELSGGEQQRLAIARALVNNPSTIIADEPTGNLDSKNGHDVMCILKELNEKGTTIVMVTHSQKDARYAHRVINLFDGLVVDTLKDRL